MPESFERTIVGDVVAADFRTARIFEQFGIDFCCGGRRSIADACLEASADPVALKSALDALADDDRQDVSQWPVEQLIKHIVTAHHAYIRAHVPTIERHLDRIVHVHGQRHPELAEIAATFDHVARDLQQHMLKEERMLFPYIAELAAHPGDTPIASPFGSVENPIRVMEREHRAAGDEMQRIRELTHGYLPPPDACGTYRTAFAELAAFDDDLHRHVHLENNVLFPQAVTLEQRACGA
ncbi:MAG TPA: iron-sulfur cluster repair di-iron protein [Vicinamibacterales bacterium]|jgi:regulator of cell morphogenesis and NO signaling|nr:iron-sulfur cluster repair di-iron protein [Vicinamibacterales bacterium]